MALIKSMALVKNGELVDDIWVTIATASELAEASRPIVSLELWWAEEGRLRNTNAPLGIRLASDQSPALIADDLDRFEMVALEFPKFTDGRAYSHARLLRERHGFRGEIRAVGNVLRDQLPFMARCGFDAFEIAGERPLEAWRDALGEIGVWYQPGADGQEPAMVSRRTARGQPC